MRRALATSEVLRFDGAGYTRRNIVALQAPLERDFSVLDRLTCAGMLMKSLKLNINLFKLDT
jgi:hypothetical protein